MLGIKSKLCTLEVILIYYTLVYINLKILLNRYALSLVTVYIEISHKILKFSFYIYDAWLTKFNFIYTYGSNPYMSK
jgi:hypothetical protein